MKFQRDRLELLKTLREFVLEEMNNAKVNVDLEYDVSEVLTEITDRKRARRLGLVRRELEKWIEETKSNRKETKDVSPIINA